MGQNQSQAPVQNKKPSSKQTKESTPRKDPEMRLSAEYIKSLQNLEQRIFELNEENVEQIADGVMELFSDKFPCTSNLIVCKLIFSSFVTQKLDFNLYFRLIKTIDSKEQDIIKTNYKLLDIFTWYLLHSETQESYYLLEMLIEQRLLDPKFVKNKKSLHFAHYKTREEINILKDNAPFHEQFFSVYDDLSHDNWKMHLQFIHEGTNPLEIAKIIRKDDVAKLKEMAEFNFDQNQIIEPSLYERCSFINKTYEKITLMDYAAFFGAIECFKFLMECDCNLENSAKYAVAGGHHEIVRLCEKGHATFKDTYETAIEFHQNNIFHYLYQNQIIKVGDLTQLGKKCIQSGNYTILEFLIQEGMKVDDSIIVELIKAGNLFLLDQGLSSKHFPKNAIVLATKSGNIELVKYLIGKYSFDINETDI